MAQQIKTLRYGLTARTTTLACDNSALASSTRHDFSSITIGLPETSGSRTFRSVELHLFAYPTAAAAISIDKVRVGLAWNGGGATDVDDTDAVGGAAAAYKGGTHEFVYDITASFAANFGSGDESDLVVGCAFVLSTAGNVMGVCGYIDISVEVDDSNARASRTWCFPFDGPVARLATSLTELGTNQIPDIEALLGDLGNPTIRQAFITAQGSCNNDGDATGNTVSWAIDGGAASDRAVITAGSLNNGYFDVWVPGLDTSAAHAFKAKQSLNVAGLGFQSLDLRLWVTADYDAPTPDSGTSVVARQIAFVLHATEVPPDASYHTIEVDFDVPEANPVMLQSGICLVWTAAGSGPGLSILCGSQSAQRDYTGRDGHVQLGNHCTSHRIDSGAANGAGHTLVRGRNHLKIRVDSTGAVSRPSGVTGVICLNYTCTTPAAGDQSCSRTVRFLQHPWKLTDVLASGFELPTADAKAPVLPDQYCLTSDPAYQVGYMLLLGANTSIPLVVGLSVETFSDERPVTGWHECPAIEVGTSPLWSGYNIGRFFTPLSVAKRWTDDPQAGLLDLEDVRKLRPSVKATRRFWVALLVDFHSMTTTVTGQITNLDSPGGITLNVRRSDTKELVGTTTSASDGSYSAVVPDPALTYELDGVDGSGNRGISKPVTPS